MTNTGSLSSLNDSTIVENTQGSITATALHALIAAVIASIAALGTTAGIVGGLGYTPANSASPTITGLSTFNGTIAATDPGSGSANPFVFQSKEALAIGFPNFRYAFLAGGDRLAGGTGNRQGAVLYQSNHANTGQTSDQIVGMQGIARNYSGAAGQIFGMFGVCQVDSGSVVGTNCIAQENDTNVQASVGRRIGMQVYDLGSTFAGGRTDAAYYLGGNVGASHLGYDHGIQFGSTADSDGIGVAATGTMIGAGAAGTAVNGIDFSFLTLNTFLRGPANSTVIDGAGNATFNGQLFLNNGEAQLSGPGFSVLALQDRNAAANNKTWWINGSGGVLHFASVLDDNVTTADWLTVTRSGGAPLLAKFSVPVTATTLKVTPLTVATLPTCNSGAEGTHSAVTDATAPTYNGTLTGGGTVHIPVYCNGAAWTAH